jgi:hypothetical protein
METSVGGWDRIGSGGISNMSLDRMNEHGLVAGFSSLPLGTYMVPSRKRKEWVWAEDIGLKTSD